MEKDKNTGFAAGAANNWEGPKSQQGEDVREGGFALQETLEGEPVRRQYPPEREDDIEPAEIPEEKTKRGQNMTESKRDPAGAEEAGFSGGATNRWGGTRSKLDPNADKGGYALQEVMEGKPVKRQYPPERENE